MSERDETTEPTPTIDTVELAPATPGDRGQRLGTERGNEIRVTLGRYAELFATAAGDPLDLGPAGSQAFASIEAWAPDLAAEIAGIAAGAGLPVEHIAALNARTEILAAIAPGGRGECSSVVVLGADPTPPLAIQNWDWHEELGGSFHLLVVHHPGGRIVRTLTEYGIVGKIGVSTARLGLLINILNHESDGGPIGVPVHVLSRRILDEADDLGAALQLVASASPSASSALTLIASEGADRLAITAEVFPAGPRYVLPDREGVLLRTNHFLDPISAVGDQAPRLGPDSFLRLASLARALGGASDAQDVRRALGSRFGGASALCTRPAASARSGDRWTTLATVELDVANGSLTVRRGGAGEPVAQQA